MRRPRTRSSCNSAGSSASNQNGTAEGQPGEGDALTVDYLIGVDGGGSGTRALVQRAGGEAVGVGTAGPSALQQGVPQAWDHVLLAIRRGFEAAGLPVPSWQRCVL